MAEYKLTFKSNTGIFVTFVNASTRANAHYQAGQIAIEKDMGNHMLRIEKVER